MNDTTKVWPLRLLALLIAVLSWFFASYLPRIEETSSPARTRTVTATIDYDNPPGLIIINPEATVDLVVRGSREAIRDLNPFQVAVSVEFRQGVETGIVEARLGPEDVSLPEGLEVLSIRPERLLLELDAEVVRVLPVTVAFTGEPAAGAQPDREATTVIPAQGEVRGPQSRLSSLSQLVAEVSVEGRALDFEIEVPLRLPTPDPLIQVVRPGVVQVLVTMRAPELPAENGQASSGSL